MVFQGTAMRCHKYFEKMGCPLEKFKNPADSFMKLLSVKYPKTQEDELRIEALVSHYREHNEPRMFQER